jgi:hypothetical protein
MPHIEPLRPAAKQDPVKHTAPPQGKITKLKLHTRDPRAGKPPRVPSPNPRYR